MMKGHDPMTAAKRSATRSPSDSCSANSRSTLRATPLRWMKRLTISRSCSFKRSSSLARNFFAVSLLETVICEYLLRPMRGESTHCGLRIADFGTEDFFQSLKVSIQLRDEFDNPQSAIRNHERRLSNTLAV